MSEQNQEWVEIPMTEWSAIIGNANKTLNCESKHERPHGLNVSEEELWSILRNPSRSVYNKPSTTTTDTYKVRGIIRERLHLLIEVRNVQNTLKVVDVRQETF